MKTNNRIRMLSAVAVSAGLALMLTVASRSPAQQPDGNESQIQRGFDISPVTLNLDGKRRSLVGLGSYIVNARGNCNNCHTCPSNVGRSASDNPFVSGGALSDIDKPGPINKDNYLAGGVHFGPGGLIVSKNLTPDPRMGNMPAGLTFEEFLSVIQTGHDPDKPDQILQTMPWPIFRHMTRHDLRAIYEFLSAIPHAEPGGSCSAPDQFVVKP
jgi:hypothetical protein